MCAMGQNAIHSVDVDQISIQIAINAGLPANMLKFITAVLFLLVLVIAGRRGEEIIHA